MVQHGFNTLTKWLKIFHLYFDFSYEIGQPFKTLVQSSKLKSNKIKVWLGFWSPTPLQQGSSVVLPSTASPHDEKMFLTSHHYLPVSQILLAVLTNISHCHTCHWYFCFAPPIKVLLYQPEFHSVSPSLHQCWRSPSSPFYFSSSPITPLYPK